MKFLKAIEELKERKGIYRESWGENKTLVNIESEPTLNCDDILDVIGDVKTLVLPCIMNYSESISFPSSVLITKEDIEADDWMIK